MVLYRFAIIVDVLANNKSDAEELLLTSIRSKKNDEPVGLIGLIRVGDTTL
jgi:hypothetical protein